ncbi:MAG: DUF751 family protein [Crocosphaera sp.]
MGDFFENVARYPRYLITFTLGVFLFFFDWIKPLFRSRISTIAVAGMVIGVFSLLYFTLRGMLGLSPL